MAGKPTKYFTLEEIRQSQRDAANKWYNDPKNKEKRKPPPRTFRTFQTASRGSSLRYFDLLYRKV